MIYLDLHYDQADGLGCVDGVSGFVGCRRVAVEVVGEELAEIWEGLLLSFVFRWESSAVWVDRSETMVKVNTNLGMRRPRHMLASRLKTESVFTYSHICSTDIERLQNLGVNMCSKLKRKVELNEDWKPQNSMYSRAILVELPKFKLRRRKNFSEDILTSITPAGGEGGTSCFFLLAIVTGL
jgi:hypothetical protein